MEVIFRVGVGGRQPAELQGGVLLVGTPAIMPPGSRGSRQVIWSDAWYHMYHIDVVSMTGKPVKTRMHYLALLAWLALIVPAVDHFAINTNECAIKVDAIHLCLWLTERGGSKANTDSIAQQSHLTHSTARMITAKATPTATPTRMGKLLDPEPTGLAGDGGGGVVEGGDAGWRGGEAASMLPGGREGGALGKEEGGGGARDSKGES